MMIPLRYVFGISMCSIAGLRISDVVWPPPQFFPWWVYAIEWGIGLALTVSAYRRYS